MYAGHLAAGLAIRAREPRATTWGCVLAAGWLDITHGLFVLAGIEHVRPDPTKFLGWELYDMPWTHSLVAAVAWSVAAALACARRGRAVALAIAIAVFSHFALDVVVHEHDLALAPGSDIKLGFALWSWSGVGAWLVEGAVIAAAVAYYLARGGSRAVAIVVGVLHVSFFPALSPMHMAGAYLA